MEMVALGSDKKWLWSEKKISVSSGSLCPLVMMRHSPPQKSCDSIGVGSGGGHATLDPQLQDMRGAGVGKGGGKRQPKQTS